MWFSLHVLGNIESNQKTSVITEPEQRSSISKTRASPATRASHCYLAIVGILQLVESINDAIFSGVSNAVTLKTLPSDSLISIRPVLVGDLLIVEAFRLLLASSSVIRRGGVDQSLTSLPIEKMTNDDWVVAIKTSPS